MTCLFCEIEAGRVQATKVYEDSQVIAIDDIFPQAPVHKLIIPKKHIATLNDLEPQDETLIGHMFLVAKKLAYEQNISEEGYRTVVNCNPGAGQTVFHIHLHLLGGRGLKWPPG